MHSYFYSYHGKNYVELVGRIVEIEAGGDAVCLILEVHEQIHRVRLNGPLFTKNRKYIKVGNEVAILGKVAIENHDTIIEAFAADF